MLNNVFKENLNGQEVHFHTHTSSGCRPNNTTTLFTVMYGSLYKGGIIIKALVCI